MLLRTDYPLMSDEKIAIEFRHRMETLRASLAPKEAFGILVFYAPLREKEAFWVSLVNQYGDIRLSRDIDHIMDSTFAFDRWHPKYRDLALQALQAQVQFLTADGQVMQISQKEQLVNIECKVCKEGRQVVDQHYYEYKLQPPKPFEEAKTPLAPRKNPLQEIRMINTKQRK